MAAPPTANEIKAQLKTLLTTPLATGKKAKILDNLGIAFDAAAREDPTELRSGTDTAVLDSGETIRRVNCLIISEEGIGQGPAQDDSTRRTTSPRGRNLITRRFRLTYFYQYGSGSEAVFSTNMELIRTTINSAPKLGFAAVGLQGTAGQGAYIDNHDGLQVGSMLPDAFGDTIIHVGEGVLTVRVIEPLGSPS